MLKLKKVQILGFKSFCDRTEVQLSGEGIAAVVGPNGCGKSNISDAITWVLGEQSAKSLRGIKMEDVIFAGTRERKPTGMAEVSLTLVDPEIYDGAALADESDVVAIDSVSDWDETSLREQRALETEEAVAEAQPGTVIEGEAIAAAAEATAELDAEAANGSNPNNVVLKIRRRKFGRAPVRAGELTITRRLFRTGDSEYLLNGKICRLRDIQDIFMGTGLGGESYAIIGQERIGQLLSSKPLDRRSIIEEAAGITRFKTKKRLAELRLESAKQNLARVNDIFEEVTKQMVTLKRQAAKAERYGALRDELRTKLRVVLASRMQQLDTEAAAAAAEIARLGAAIDTQTATLETMDAEHTEGVRHGYALDGLIREAGAVANQSAVELERIVARTAANSDRIAELGARLASGGEELEAARLQLAQLAGEQEQHKSFLESATAESGDSRKAAEAQQQQAQAAIRALAVAEQQVEQNRRSSMQLLQRASQTRNEEAQAEAALAGLERERERLTTESEAARQELTQLGHERGQAKLSFESVTERLKRLEAEIAAIRLELEAARAEEVTSKRRGDQLRGEQAALLGRKSSLESLIREHSYSTDTVKNLFRARTSGGLSPLGTLADFLEVEGKYESVVDEFLRDELNFVVVRSWDAAGEGLRLLEKDVAGRATFLVHGEDAQTGFGEALGDLRQPAGEGVAALKDCIRVRDGVDGLDGLGRSLQAILPRLRDGFVVADAMQAKSLAAEFPWAYFLAPTGETYHHTTVTGGRTRAQGPLALKRELNEVEQKVAAAAAELAAVDLRTAELQHQIATLSGTLDTKGHERRDAEREAANSGAALRQMDAEAQRIERRLADWQLNSERNRDARSQKAELIARKQQEAAALDAERVTLEAGLDALQQRLVELKVERETLQQSAATASAALAGLEERRRNAAANLEQTTRLYNTQTQRIQQLDGQLRAAEAERLRREEETAQLAVQHTELSETRATAVSNGARLTAEATELRTRMTELDQRLRSLRHETEALREERAALTARAAKLASDIEHIEATCLNDLAVEAVSLREDAEIVRIEGEALTAEEEQARGLKQRLEAMGPVNMMALEEYNETATRHSFMEEQRKDLLDSIENTQASIKEIDDVSRIKFDEAFAIINENFSVTFTKLFGGGQALMKLTDAENSNESGIDIVASPPGKKLQNILLLSGGEKALTALSLLVGIFQFQPAPFCVLDEVDAPLDETNVGRFARLIAEMSQNTQFVVITHSKRTMAEADVIYGVTMQEPGVSKIVSVKLGKGNRSGEQDRRAVA